MTRLHTVAIDNSQTSAEPVVFLHGFGGVADQWWGLQTAISFITPTYAFDLPGHGESINFPDAGPPKIAAKAVLAELQSRGVEKAHFVGHSMGGAIASLIALIAPQFVASLTLLAPGGYGSELNHVLLHKWAAASQESELEAVLPEFFGPDYELSDKVIDFQLKVRQADGAVEKLTEMANNMFEGGEQGVLPISDVLAGQYPIAVVWGTDDKVLPVTQADALQDKVDLHVVDGMGHSPAEEEPELVLKLIKDQLKT